MHSTPNLERLDAPADLDLRDCFRIIRARNHDPCNGQVVHDSRFPDSLGDTPLLNDALHLALTLFLGWCLWSIATTASTLVPTLLENARDEIGLQHLRKSRHAAQRLGARVPRRAA